MEKNKPKISSFEIAQKQRYLHLLQKVKDGKTLTKVELGELRRYERESNLTTTAISKRQIKPVVSSTGKKKPTGKDGKKRRNRLPVSEAEVRFLALECENLTEANTEIKSRKSLEEIFKKHPRLKKAWDRGRFLRGLREVASQAPSLAQAAGQLGFSERKFKELIDSDLEIEDIWKQEQLKLYVQTRRQVFDMAQNGNSWAIKVIDNILQTNAGPKAGILEVTANADQLAKLTGKTVRTIYNWRTKCGLERNTDKTFHLGTFMLWYESYLIKKASGENTSIRPLDPLKAVKAEKLKVELAHHRNQLLDRDEVIMGQIAWVQNIITFCKRGAEELAKLCSNQPREKIEEIAKGFFRNLHKEAAKVPNELNLPAAKEKQLIDFLLSLRPHEGIGT